MKKYVPSLEELDNIFQISNKENWVDNIKEFNIIETEGAILFRGEDDIDPDDWSEDLPITLDALKNGYNGPFEEGDIILSNDGSIKLYIISYPPLDKRVDLSSISPREISIFGVNYSVGFMDPKTDEIRPLGSDYIYLDNLYLKGKDWKKIGNMDYNEWVDTINNYLEKEGE